jgi:heme O synthase-like polyprenyltransferase
MAYRKDYARAEFPMLPVNVSPQQASWWVGIHTLTTSLIAIVLGFHPVLGWAYIIPVVFVSTQFVRLTIQLIRNPTGSNALRLFKFSNLFLGVVLLTAIILPLIG